ncbi:LytTR family transcriptional regulator DNA-binding domain-containing protein [Fulvivirga ulvae]|uniref:LytR/AlgR family response regulator transcription factor n=1 Tax=Fulvivirga ulvae TaxID=2904245 RepID=UPI001F339095|nr:LytTR family transcriptional regulator DNA-binding domain-containing protein [Fulvivirga ulvae]UII33955.1 LytTR family transcriptional regulator DNA-binding domain-containing protein [Fulvivirga ulvae]
MIKTLIIDDEKLARDVIRAYLKSHSDIEIVSECANGFEGVKAIHEVKPDLIFLDVQMPKLTGFEMLELLDTVPVIIFSTAYDKFALKAFEQSAADYLLKPYSQSRFNEAISKARQRLTGGGEDKELITKIQESREVAREGLDRLVVRLGSKIVIISLDKIDFIEAQDDYVAIHSEGKKYLKQLTMKYLESSLPENQFVRVHRSFIVSISSIDRLEAMSKDTYMAILKTGIKIPVSRSGYGSLKEVLNF